MVLVNKGWFLGESKWRLIEVVFVFFLKRVIFLGLLLKVVIFFCIYWSVNCWLNKFMFFGVLGFFDKVKNFRVFIL